MPIASPRPHPLLLAALLMGAAGAIACPPAAAQGGAESPIHVAGGPGPATVRVTDARLGDALRVLVEASPTAARALEAVQTGGLPVVIGTVEQLSALPEAVGGFGAAERRHLLGEIPTSGPSATAPIASVVFRADSASRGSGANPAVERAWVFVEVDVVEALLERAGYPDVADRLQLDLLAILAHEFVAHVGSVARTRRVSDLCDDPSELQRRRTSDARMRGELPPLDGEMAACSLRVENRVRRELNRALSLRGDRAFPDRLTYTMEAMHFGRGTR